MAFVKHIVWDQRLAVGHPEIDRQHRSWVETANRLLDIEGPAADPDGFRAAVEELLAYTDYHFRTEEEFMAARNYDRLEAQRQAHAEIARRMRDLFDAEFDAPDAMTELKDFLSAWVIDHIIQEDLLLRRITGYED